MSVANEESELQKDLEQVEETVSNRSVVKTLRELVNYAKVDYLFYVLSIGIGFRTRFVESETRGIVAPSMIK